MLQAIAGACTIKGSGFRDMPQLWRIKTGKENVQEHGKLTETGKVVHGEHGFQKLELPFWGRPCFIASVHFETLDSGLHGAHPPC